MPSYTDAYENWKAQGRPGGSFQAWQGGQAAAPAAPAASAPVAAGPGAFNQDWMNQGLAAYAAGQRGSDPNQTPGFNPATFMQEYAQAGGGNRPEDLARWLDPNSAEYNPAVIAGWMPFYDPQQGKYRSMRGAEGWFDKPTECPPGTGPSGPNETDPCTPVGYGGQAAPAASGAAPAAQVNNGGFPGAASPLQSLMATQGAAPAKPSNNPFMQGIQTSGLVAAMTPLQAQPQRQQTDGLTGTVMPWQRRKQENTGWFTGMR